MSTKRQMKKENQRSEALGRRLEDLYRRGADEAFLDLVHERCRSLPELPAAAFHGEVVDRALRRALMGRDWNQTARILKRLRRDVAGDRPMVRLAEAALRLVEGCLDEARAGLASLTRSDNGASPVPACLVTALEALTEPAAQGDPYVQELARRLDGLREQGFRVTPQDIRSFEVILAALEEGVTGDAATGKLLRAARERLRLLDLLGVLERDLLRRQDDERLTVLDLFMEETSEEWRSLLEAFRAEPPWNLVRPLHHAARLAWRGLLQIVAEKEGPEAWPEIAGIWPELLYLDLQGEDGARSLEAGRLWLHWKESLTPAHVWNLADFLESKSRGEKDPERLAALWEAELWARRKEARLKPGRGEAAKAALARLERFASDAGRRLPPEWRPELARRLRESLLDLCELDDYSRHFLTAATALLEHREDDPAVLAVALASAVCACDDRAVDRFTERIAARGVASEEEQEDVFEVVSHLAKEEWPDIARCLPRLRPLLDGKDLEAAERRMANAIVDDFILDLANGWRREELHDMRIALGATRRELPEVPVLALLDSACGCLDAATESREVLRRFLEENPSLEAALMVYRVMNAGYPWAPDNEEAIALVWQSREAIIDRFDHHWRVWWKCLPELIEDAEEEELQRLASRLEELLELEGLDEGDLIMLRGTLAKVRREEPSPPEEDDDEEEDWEDEPGTDESQERIRALLERLFPPPRLVLKPLEPAPEPLQPKDLEPLLRPLRRQAVEEALRKGLSGNRS